MKNYLVVKPGCLLDASIKLRIELMFASNGQYSATHSKIVEVDLGQLQKDALAEELDHEYKYRFLYVSDEGEIISLYNPNQPT